MTDSLRGLMPSRPPVRASLRRRLLAAGAVACLALAGRWSIGGAGAAPLPTAATTTTVATATSVAGTTASAKAVSVVAAAAVPTKPAKRLGKAGALMFPMQTRPTCKILDNFGDGRSGGRRHEGVDIGGDLGQEIYAVASGTLTKWYVDGTPDAVLAGNGWRLTLPDKTFYFYAHLSAFAEGLEPGDTVVQGQLLGYVGDTGDPAPGSYHLHFEVHPQGGAAVDPLTLLEIPAGCTIY